MRTNLIALMLIFGVCSGKLAAEPKPPSVGIVNFATCMTESKMGKQEQTSFDSQKKQIASLLEDTEKQMSELTVKFNDPEYMDGLSPEGEEELKNKFRMLNDEMSRYQNQYYQVLNQANMKIVQTMSANIQEAAEKVAKSKKLTMVINKEACFFYTSGLDVTNYVIAELDKAYELSAGGKMADGSEGVKLQPASATPK